MIADSCAMVIDSMTYLFNSWAERIKNRSLNEEEKTDLSEGEKEMKRLDRTRQRLLLEIAPPLCSVLTFIGLTISVSKEAMDTLTGGDVDLQDDEVPVISDEDPNVGIMFFFSGLNLVLDILNVTCFARARHAFGFAVIDEDRHRYMLAYDGSLHNVFADSFNKSQSEVDLHKLSEEEDINDTEQKNYSSIVEEREEATKERDGVQEVNLNMCSAYTVRVICSLITYGNPCFKQKVSSSLENSMYLRIHFEVQRYYWQQVSPIHLTLERRRLWMRLQPWQ